MPWTFCGIIHCEGNNPVCTSRNKARQTAAVSSPSLPHTSQFLMLLFSQNTISELSAATSAPRRRCVECEINKGWEINPQQEEILIPLQLSGPCQPLGSDTGTPRFAWLCCCCSAPLFWLSSGEKLRKTIISYSPSCSDFISWLGFGSAL